MSVNKGPQNGLDAVCLCVCATVPHVQQRGAVLTNELHYAAMHRAGSDQKPLFRLGGRASEGIAIISIKGQKM